MELCLEELKSLGYACKSFLLDARWYGLPQSRRRVYIVCLSLTDRRVGCSARDFFDSVKNLLTKLYIEAPSAVAQLGYVIMLQLCYVCCMVGCTGEVTYELCHCLFVYPTHRQLEVTLS